MNEVERETRIQGLLELPYRKVIRGNSEDGFLAEVPELPGCLTAGETEAEALGNLREAMAAWFESALIDGDPIPEPRDRLASRYSGRILLRMPPSLHQRLAQRAEEEGVSINQLAVTTLARGVGP